MLIYVCPGLCDDSFSKLIEKSVSGDVCSGSNAGHDENCHTCRCVLGTTTQGEVSYKEIWLCLQCHIMERELKSIKGKGTVERVYRQCDGRCGGASAVARDCTPVWFCYDCCQYLCDPCVESKHDKHVSL